MVYTVIDHRNDGIKCSKLKWSIRVHVMENYGPFVFYNNIYFFTKNQNQKQPALCDMLSHFFGLYSHRP